MKHCAAAESTVSPPAILRRRSDAAPNAFTRIAVLAVLVIAVTAIYWSSVASLAAVSGTQNHRHGYLVPFVSAWLIWTARNELARIPWRHSWFGVAVLAILVWGWAVSRVALVQAAEHLLLVLMLNAAVLAVAGFAAYRQLAFPLLYLLFAVPIGESMVPFLMRSTADIAMACLSLFGVPVFRDGQFFTLSGGAFHIADVCSGMSYFLAGLALGTVAAYSMFRSNVKRVVFVITIGAGSIALNGVRAALVMGVASASNMRYLSGYDHVVFGWILFLVGGVLLCWVAARYFGDQRADDGG